jgi:hypothetical protein
MHNYDAADTYQGISCGDIADLDGALYLVVNSFYYSSGIPYFSCTCYSDSRSWIVNVHPVDFNYIRERIIVNEPELSIVRLKILHRGYE